MDIKQYKKDLVTQNMRLIEYGPLKNLPIYKSIRNKYNDNFQIQNSDTFCDVYVLKGITNIAVAESYSGKYSIAVVNMMTDDYDGGSVQSSRGFIDDTINVRTNLYKSIANMYPINKGEVAYSKDVTVIRNNKYQTVPKDFFKINVITTLIHFLQENQSDVTLDDYMLVREIVETIFQTAIISRDEILILSDFGCVSNGKLIRDIVDIYNLCILKYGHHFKYIVILVDVKNSSSTPHYYYFLKNIIIPQDLIDRKTNTEQQQDETFESQLSKLQQH